MAEEATTPDDDKTEPNKPADDKPVTDDPPEDASTGDEGGEDEGEIVLAGEEGSQPDTQHFGIRRRVNKLNRKVTAAREGEATATEALRIEQERNRLLQLALDQKRDTKPEALPDPNDFDDGASDPKYVAALTAHITKDVKAGITTAPVDTPRQRGSADLEGRQVEHYRRADTLKVRDYDATEDKAVDILGRDFTNQVIASAEKSPEILYHLGKNPEKAEEIKELLETDPVKGVLRIGALEARLSVKPRARTNNAPDPDTELEGATAPKASDFERKLDKLRVKAQETGDISPVLAFKRKHNAGSNA